MWPYQFQGYLKSDRLWTWYSNYAYMFYDSILFYVVSGAGNLAIIVPVPAVTQSECIFE